MVNVGFSFFSTVICLGQKFALVLSAQQERLNSAQHPNSLPNNSHFKSLSQDTSNQQIRFVMIRIEFKFCHFKSIPLWASGEDFRKQTKGEKASLLFEVW